MASMPPRRAAWTRIAVVCGLGLEMVTVMIALNGASGLRYLRQLGHQLAGLAVVSRARIEGGTWSHVASGLIAALLRGAFPLSAPG